MQAPHTEAPKASSRRPTRRQSRQRARPSRAHRGLSARVAVLKARVAMLKYEREQASDEAMLADWYQAVLFETEEQEEAEALTIEDE